MGIADGISTYRNRPIAAIFTTAYFVEDGVFDANPCFLGIFTPLSPISFRGSKSGECLYSVYSVVNMKKALIGASGDEGFL